MGAGEALGTQVYLTHKGKVLIISITRNDVAANAPDANQIIDSLRLN